MKKLIEISLLLDMEKIKNYYKRTLGMIRSGVPCSLQVDGMTAGVISWHNRLDEAFAEQVMVEAVSQAGKRLMAWTSVVRVGWPQSQIKLLVNEHHLGLEDVMLGALERYVRLTAESRKLAMHAPAADKVLRPMVEQLEQEAERELTSIVEVLAICE